MVAEGTGCFLGTIASLAKLLSFLPFLDHKRRTIFSTNLSRLFRLSETVYVKHLSNNLMQRKFSANVNYYLCCVCAISNSNMSDTL